MGEKMDKPLIAIVEGAPEILSLMAEGLGDAGYRVVTGENADDVEGILADELPNLLILDVRLPGTVTGLPLLHAMRDNPATAHLPILIATADVTFLRENAGALKSLGCETLPKPFDIDSLLGCVASLIPVGGHQ
jgi:two-component system alkaline phosphatase synthesis response regulator PhoP